MDIIAELKKRQGEMSQGQFAAKLAISEAMLSLIYSGERRIGESLARRIVRVYPELQWSIAGYIMSKGDNGLQEGL